ncbi:MAG TPA: hypothetical protein VD997_15830 [Phycisphaerales bacterium]|nr:hypothetical protein [Phycisphaerales bacterium]
MTLNLFVLAVTLFVAYMWVIRGFFSALIHLVCTVIAGAVAFGVWEPVSYWILESAPTTGVGAHLTGMAWGIGLLVPFALTLGLLRLGVDQLLPANVVLSQKLNYAGGAVCGIIAGVLTGGIVAIGLGYFRTNIEFGTPVKYVSGNLKRTGALWLPIDKITAEVYGNLSERAFRTGEPLAKWHPDVHEEGGTLHLTAFDGKNRNTTRLSDFEVISRFAVGESGKGKFSSYLTDQWKAGTVQRVFDLDGNPFPENSTIEGLVVKFKATARDKDGKFSIGAAQTHLLLENADGDTMRVHPIAVSSQAQSDKADLYGRWWLDAEGTFIASVGAAAEPIFSFEYPCPPGYKPIAVYIKGARSLIDSSKKPNVVFRSAAERDGAIASGFKTLGNVAPVNDLDLSEAAPAERVKQAGTPNPPLDRLNVSDILPFTIQKGTHDQLEIDEEKDKNIVINGEVKLKADMINAARGIDRKLEIKRLLVAEDQVIVQVDASDYAQWSILHRAFVNQEGNDVPTLYDQNNVPYVPVGWAYQDETILWLRYTPGNPITKFDELPRMSASRAGQKITLLYRVSRGVSLKHYGCGKKITRTIEPPFLLDQRMGAY